MPAPAPRDGRTPVDALRTKSKRVVDLVQVLTIRLGADAFRLVDHWPDDPLAIGVASPGNAAVLAYVSVAPGSAESFFVSLERPPEGLWADHPYTPEDDRSVSGVDELVAFISRHLESA